MSKLKIFPKRESVLSDRGKKIIAWIKRKLPEKEQDPVIICDECGTEYDTRQNEGKCPECKKHFLDP